MNNFEYIISSLPVLSPEYRYAPGESFAQTVSAIREQLSAKDARVLDFLLKGFDAESLTEDFYSEALSHPDGFIREYFLFDMNLRNAKVRYLNGKLGRPAGMDVMDLDPEGLQPPQPEFREAARTDAALELTDLLSRERALDDVTWEKLDEMAAFHYFDLTAVLVFVARLHIADRWLSLDRESGKEMFRRLVDEVRGTYKGVNYTE